MTKVRRPLKPRYTSSQIQFVHDLIMPIEEYYSFRFDIPFCFELKSRKGSLYYFGTGHFTDPANPLFKTIVDTFHLFKPDYVLVESKQKLYTEISSQDRNSFRDSYASISPQEALKMAEANLAIKLAQLALVEVESPEPTLCDIFQHLGDAGFSPDDIAAYYLLRAASNYPLYQKLMSFDEFIDYRVRQLEEEWPYDSSLLTWQHAWLHGINFWGETTVNDPEALKARLSPVLLKNDSLTSVLSDIAASASVFVDVYVTLRIGELVGSGQRVFTLYGASHAVRQERAVRTLLNSSEPGTA